MRDEVGRSDSGRLQGLQYRIVCLQGVRKFKTY